MSTGSYICDLNGTLPDELVARYASGFIEIAVIDNGSNGFASYTLIMTQLVGEHVSVVFEEFYDNEKQAVSEFIGLVQQEAGIGLEEVE